jgi:hypothetical protein
MDAPLVADLLDGEVHRFDYSQGTGDEVFASLPSETWSR